MPLKTAVRESWLPGVKLVELERFVDERGLFHELMRLDWKGIARVPAYVGVDRPT